MILIKSLCWLNNVEYKLKLRHNNLQKQKNNENKENRNLTTPGIYIPSEN